MSPISQPELLAILPKEVNTIHDAEAMLLALAQCNKMYHFDDDPKDIACFNSEEAEVVDALMDRADEVTRVHYGMMNSIEPRAALWNGLVKDVLPIGYMCFGANEKTLYVYDYDRKLVTTDLTEWERVKAAAFDRENEEYNWDYLTKWVCAKAEPYF